jgi:hypothetical protein
MPSSEVIHSKGTDHFGRLGTAWRHVLWAGDGGEPAAVEGGGDAADEGLHGHGIEATRRARGLQAGRGPGWRAEDLQSRADKSQE